MGTLLGLAILAFALASLILPWVHGSRLSRLEQEVGELRAQLHAPHKASVWQTANRAGLAVEDEPRSEIAAPIPTPSAKEEIKEKKEKRDFERQFGARLPVWVGGVALAFAGFFLVKYSIETGMLTEQIRTLLGGLFGIALLGAGQWVLRHPYVSDKIRIAQALSGAGIADLYICLFAATSLYHLLPSFVGFAGMAAVTAMAVGLSLRHGAPIALLGLIGGFLTPALVGSSSPDAPTLFLYLYGVSAGLLAVTRKQHWWWMAIPTVLGVFIWAAVWAAGSYGPHDGFWLGLFLLAISMTVIVMSKQAMEEAPLAGLAKWLNALTLGGGAVLMGAVVGRSGYGLTEWSLFGLLALGGIVLAARNQKLYGFAPWVSLAITAIMLLTWHYADAHIHALTIAAFAALYGISGYLLMRRTEKPEAWAGLMAASSIGYYLIAYHTLHQSYDADVPLWSMMAIGFALLASHLIRVTLENFQGPEMVKQRILGILVMMGTAFVSLALIIELERDFLSVAVAGQVLALSWLTTRLDIKALRPLAGILAAIYGILLLPQILLLVQCTVYSVTEIELHLQHSLPIVDWPIFQLGLPAAMFVGASLFLRRQKDGKLPHLLELASVGLIAVMGYYLTRHAFHIDENLLFVKANFIERGVITDILLLYGLGCCLLGRRFDRNAVWLGGLTLIGAVLFRITYFDLLIYNPLWSHQSVGNLPLLNGLLLTYGLPALGFYAVQRELGYRQLASYQRGAAICMLVLVFTYVTLAVRQLYQGEFLDVSTAGNAETYSYSAAWLLLGTGLLLAGTWKRDQAMRIASLLVMILTAGKVFLYDASALTGLFRVLSFFGLGVSLMGLSCFYTRFVFGKDNKVG